ncbi:lipopolysaccharide biosynthesis protein [Mucilaginibacter sp. SJ]|uniref:lipopolysaccharide biosynthesis protein n=1 Tax=Mucilaginibacter sp. SJ TaxID=3029053 RepID=UPI0023A9EBB5|nr:lipopolysaccharide biosynthesis protein [Mucilaginibacter sp. SJ]WEA02315.1 lipopolysaccharide biosynthesis protein [Mucilaginibacter sp. SJ]
MSKESQYPAVLKANELSFNDISIKIKSAIEYIKTKWITVLLISLLGAIVGLAYAIYKKATYTAVCTFVLEESGKGGGLGQYAGLASLAGINVGNGGSDGIFQGDNILELYRSRTMIEKTLLSEVSIDGQKQLLINRYIKANELREKWKSKKNTSNITFSGDPEKFNRTQDSIITDLVEYFNKRVLTVAKPDKKLSIIRVSVVVNDELFAKEFTNALVENVNTFYTQTKTKKEHQNVSILQHQADSVKKALNASITGVASALDAAPNANPLLTSLKVPSQKRQIDVQASSAIYAEVVKNLELAKVSLRQETPLIQVIDKPVLPLTKNFIGKIKGLTLGFILGFIFIFILLIVGSLFKKQAAK